MRFDWYSWFVGFSSGMLTAFVFILCSSAQAASIDPRLEPVDLDIIIEHTCTPQEIARYEANGWDAFECDWDKTEVLTAKDKPKDCPAPDDEYAADAFAPEFLNWCQARNQK